MLTTIGPANGPAGTVASPERNIGTVVSCATCHSPIPAAISACSKVKEHPSATATKSPRQRSRISRTTASGRPSRWTV